MKLPITAALFSAALLGQAPALNKQPKLILAIIVDQFRYDYLTRFREDYTGGLNRLLNHGAVFSNANLEHYPTVTAVGHATFLSGATPAFSGIVGNDWYDRETNRNVTSVSDDSVTLLGGAGGAASPHRLLVSTIGDELKMSDKGRPRVIGVSLKDRAAILTVGRGADAAYWYDTSFGSFVTSTYYVAELPRWVKAFNDEHLSAKYAGNGWMLQNLAGPKSIQLPDAAGPSLYAGIYNSPFGNELLARFALAALRSEKLGQRGATDLLSVSFSSNDAVGHAFGPDSPEVRETAISTDRVLEQLFVEIDKLVGMGNVLVVLTADHGVAPLPETLTAHKMGGGRMTQAALFGPLQAALEEKFGPGQWVLGTAGSSPYLNYTLITEKGLDESEVRRVAAKAVLSVPHVLKVYTREQLLSGQVPLDPYSQRVARSFNARRSGDLEILLEPYWIRAAKGATHGTPYSYDAHVPLIFMGPGIRPGHYSQQVALNDVAPTLATMLNIETPSGSAGRVLTEMLP